MFLFKLEEWLPVPNLVGLEASSWGRIKTTPFYMPTPYGNGIRKSGGKPHEGWWSGGRKIFNWRGKTYKVARVVCETFNGPSPFAGAVVMHLDENSANNAPDNLKWGTQKENLNAPGFIEKCRKRGKARIKFAKLVNGKIGGYHANDL